MSGAQQLKGRRTGQNKKSTVKQKTRTDVSHEADLDREKIHLRKRLYLLCIKTPEVQG